jgi:hypothetical protein
MRLALLAVFLSGCAATDCRTANWYDLGFRDAIFGMQPQDNVYASRCDKSGAQFDSARYAQGWREGKYEADSRRAESHD